MRALEIIRDETLLCRAGTECASLLSATFSLFVEEPGQATLRVAGMNELGEGRTSHTCWFDDEPIVPGQSFCIRFADVHAGNTPASEVATDSEQYVADQTWYRAEVEDGLLEPREVARNWPAGSLTICAQPLKPVTATFEGGREFITLTLSWNQWRPDYCRYSLSSFSQAEAVARTGSKEWLQGKLQLGESCLVRLGT